MIDRGVEALLAIAAFPARTLRDPTTAVTVSHDAPAGLDGYAGTGMMIGQSRAQGPADAPRTLWATVSHRRPQTVFS